ncbi:TraB/GumN family protein [Marinomonas sp. THO17]
MLSPEDYPLPSAYDQAYQSADVVVFETNLNALNQGRFQRQLQSVMMLPNDDKLHQYLDKITFMRLSDYLARHQIPYSRVENFTPAALSFFLTLQALNEFGMTQEGVDLHFAKKAQQDGKTQLWLETPEEQIALLNSLNHIGANTIIHYTLDDINDLPSTMTKIKKSWRSGKLEALNENEIMEFKTDYPDVYYALLTQRNAQWAPQIKQMLNTPQIEFIMVGALHLAGPDSVLRTLSEQGYRIEQW